MPNIKNKANSYFLFLLLCVYLGVGHSVVFGSDGKVVNVTASIGENKHTQNKPNTIYSYGGKTVDISLRFGKHCLDDFALKVQFRQNAGKIAVPLGTVHELPFGYYSEKDIINENSFSIGLPAVERETDFELLYFIQRIKKGSWELSGTTLIKIYPQNIFRQLHGYEKKIVFVIYDPSNTLQTIFKKEKIPFVDFFEDGNDDIDNNQNKLLIGLSNIGDIVDSHAEDELAEKLIMFEDMIDSIVIFKKKESRFSDLYIERKNEKYKMIADAVLIEDILKNPVSQKNLIDIIEMFLNFINLGNED